MTQSSSYPRWLVVATLAAPPLTIVALAVTYAVSPAFYQRYVLDAYLRERQAVEIATFISLLLAGLLLVPAVVRLWRVRRRPGGGLAVAVVASVLLASLFVAGEEIDWGDSYGLWGEHAPKGELEALNLHNTLHKRAPIRVKSLGSVYLVMVFFVLPLAWVFRERLRLPSGLRSAVPPGPVVFAMAVAFVWRWFKSIYVLGVGEDNLGVYEDGGFYWGFVEQINEHKELLIGIALLAYALWRLGPIDRDEITEQSSE